MVNERTGSLEILSTLGPITFSILTAKKKKKVYYFFLLFLNTWHCGLKNHYGRTHTPHITHLIPNSAKNYII